jgi:hypothetical protein
MGRIEGLRSAEADKADNAGKAESFMTCTISSNVISLSSFIVLYIVHIFNQISYFSYGYAFAISSLHCLCAVSNIADSATISHPMRAKDFPTMSASA